METTLLHVGASPRLGGSQKYQSFCQEGFALIFLETLTHLSPHNEVPQIGTNTDTDTIIARLFLFPLRRSLSGYQPDFSFLLAAANARNSLRARFQAGHLVENLPHHFSTRSAIVRWLLRNCPAAYKLPLGRGAATSGPLALRSFVLLIGKAECRWG